MLGKLIKHEFRATAKTMGLLYLIVVGSAVLGAVSAIILNSTDNAILSLLCGLILFAVWVAVIASFVMPIIVMVKRFHSGVLSDEAYLTHTLPVSIHEILGSRMFVSAVWFIATAVVDMLALLLALLTLGSINGGIDLSQLISGFDGLFDYLTVQYAVNGVAYILEFIVIIFLGCFASSLLFYAAMATGYGFAKRKTGLSVLFYFVYALGAQFIGMVPLMTWGFANANTLPAQLDVSVFAQAHILLFIIIGLELLYCAVFYVITWLNLKKRLNLE